MSRSVIPSWSLSPVVDALAGGYARRIAFVLCVAAGLLASVAMKAGAEAWSVSLTESSHYHSLLEDNGPANLLDGDRATCWAEGALGDGGGEWVELDFAEPRVVAQIGIANGCQNGQSWTKTNRVRTLDVLYDNGAQETLFLTDTADVQYFPLPVQATRTLRLRIASVYPSEKLPLLTPSRTCISEVVLIAGGCAPLPAGAFASSAAAPASSSDVVASLAPAVSASSEVEPAPFQSGTVPLAAESDPMSPISPVSETPAAPPKTWAAPADSLAERQRAVQVVRTFYIRLFTLDDDYTELYSRAVRSDEELGFEVFRETMRQRGHYAFFREAAVDLSGLTFTPGPVKNAEVHVTVTGSYVLHVAHIQEQEPEDAVFSLVWEDQGWRIRDKIDR